MIEANHLRTGNKIYDAFGNTVTVRAIHGHENKKSYHKFYTHLIMVEESGNQYNLAEVQPIPLSHDLMLIMGFSRIANGYTVGLTNGVLVKLIDRNCGTGNLSLQLDMGYISSPVLSVHDLQNHCFYIGDKQELPLPEDFKAPAIGFNNTPASL
jgi:hypothetical protein